MTFCWFDELEVLFDLLAIKSVNMKIFDKNNMLLVGCLLEKKKSKY